MTNPREDQIRQRAHEIWEREGRPHGRHEDHWRQATEEIGREAGLDPAEVAQMSAMQDAPSDPAAPAPARRRRAGTAPTSDGTASPPKARKAKAASAEGPSDGPPKPRRSLKATGAGTTPEAAPTAAPTGRKRRATKAGTSGEAPSS